MCRWLSNNRHIFSGLLLIDSLLLTVYAGREQKAAIALQLDVDIDASEHNGTYSGDLSLIYIQGTLVNFSIKIN